MTVTGTKEVTMTATEGKPKRQSFRGAVKRLGEKVTAKIAEVEASRENVIDVNAKHASLEAELRALTDAYDLVKPQPRKRGAK